MGWLSEESWFNSQQGQEISFPYNIETSSETYPASSSMDTGCPTLGKAVVGVGSRPLTCIKF